MMDIRLGIDEYIAKMSLPELTELLTTVVEEIKQRATEMELEMEDAMEQ